MNDLLEYIVKNLVSKPDQVKIEEKKTADSINLNFSVDKDDMGIVIGKAGQTIRAIRKLLIVRNQAENNKLRVNLNLQEAK